MRAVLQLLPKFKEKKIRKREKAKSEEVKMVMMKAPEPVDSMFDQTASATRTVTLIFPRESDD